MMSMRLLKVRSELPIVAGGVCVAAGTALIAISARGAPISVTAGLLGLLLGISGAVVLLFALNAMHRQSIMQAVVGTMRSNLTHSGDEGLLGLSQVVHNAKLFDYTQMLLHSRTLSIVLNQGQPWIAIHQDRLRQRFSDPTKETTIFLVHPDSPAVEMLARKANTEREGVLKKIQDTIRMLDGIKGNTDRVHVYGHSLFNTYFACVADNEAAISPYFVSRGSTVAPLFVFSNVGVGCYFREIVSDVDRLKLDSSHIENFISISYDPRSKHMRVVES